MVAVGSIGCERLQVARSAAQGVFSEDFPWDPRNQTDPEYQYSRLNEGLKKRRQAAARDAIGAARTGGGGQPIRWPRCSEESCRRYAQAQNMFNRLGQEWNVPFEGPMTAM
jgi:hypothetical protein